MQVRGQPGPPSELKAGLDRTGRPCLRKTKTKPHRPLSRPRGALCHRVQETRKPGDQRGRALDSGHGHLAATQFPLLPTCGCLCPRPARWWSPGPPWPVQTFANGRPRSPHFCSCRLSLAERVTGDCVRGRAPRPVSVAASGPRRTGHRSAGPGGAQVCVRQTQTQLTVRNPVLACVVVVTWEAVSERRREPRTAPSAPRAGWRPRGGARPWPARGRGTRGRRPARVRSARLVAGGRWEERTAAPAGARRAVRACSHCPHGAVAAPCVRNAIYIVREEAGSAASRRPAVP